MPTDKPFDVRVVNSLERPTINDFNLAQAAMRTTIQSLAQATLDMPSYIDPAIGGGFIGRGFEVYSVGLSLLKISQGLGFGYATDRTTQQNVGGITGVDVFNTAPAYPLVHTSDSFILVPTAPGAGKARRDYVLARKPTIGELTDQTASDTFNPTAQTFTAKLNRKTFTWSYDESEIEYLPVSQGLTATANFLYLTGIEYDYSTPNDFLSMPDAPLPLGYFLLAVVNVKPNATDFTNEVCDYRPIIFPGRAITLPISFSGGSAGGQPGAWLAAFNNPRVPFDAARVSVTKSGGTPGNYTSNRYLITIAGLANMRSVTGVFQAGGPVFDGNPSNFSSLTVVTTTALKSAAEPSRLTEGDVAALADPLQSMPARTYAVGQPYSRVELAMGVQSDSYIGVNYGAAIFNTANVDTRTIGGTVTLAY